MIMCIVMVTLCASAFVGCGSKKDNQCKTKGSDKLVDMTNKVYQATKGSLKFIYFQVNLKR